jgi:folate-dependent tRNA-U54 methylase TrmFO/GidA
MTNEVAELLDALHAGTLTTEDVAERFKVRKWPRRRREALDAHAEILAGETSDPDVYVPGSFDDVMAAFAQQKIDREQFRILSEAVAEAQRAEDAAG